MVGAVIYVRVSDPRQAANLSLGTQLRACEEYCGREGFQILERFTEEGESAKTADRTELQRLLQYCRSHKGKVHFVVVYNLTRFAREKFDHFALRAHLKSLGISLRSATEPIDDTSTGKLMEGVLAAFAQFDNDVRSDRTRAGMRAALEAGRWTFRAPLGYLNAPRREGKSLVFDPERAPLVRHAFEQFATGRYSQQQVLNEVTARGLRARHGGPLRKQMFHNILRNPMYIGLVTAPEYGIRDVRGDFVPLVTEAVFYRVQGILEGRVVAIGPHLRERSEFPLRSFVRCQACGRGLTGSWSKGATGNRHAYYHCRSGPCRAINVKKATLEGLFAEELERLQPSEAYMRLVKDAVIRVWQEERAAVQEQIAESKRRVDAIQAKLDRLSEAFIFDKAIDIETYDRQRDRLHAQLTLARIDQHKSALDDLDVEGILAFAERILPSVRDVNYSCRSHYLAQFVTRRARCLIEFATAWRTQGGVMVAISTTARQELVRAVSERYRATVPADEKGRILDEFVALAGYHRKHAIRVLNGFVGTTTSTKRGRLRLYDEAVRQALIVFWEASDRICGKRLKPLLPVLLPALEGHGHLTLDPTVRTQLLAVSAATIDRMLSGARTAAGGRRSRAKTTPAVRRRVPVRTFADWHDPAPGFVEADLVVHCGESMAGSFASTLVLTDIASGWTECIALLVREGSLVVDALDRLRATLPFPLRGIDTDNGSEFINELLITFCADHGIEFTRSRPYRKNDQAWVEQKNGSVVRRLVGYGRLEGVASGDALARLYSASRLFVNFFQPSFKLAEKERIGAHVRKRYHAPETPCARLLASTAIAESMKDRLRAVLGTLDPLRLLDEIRTVQHHLAALAAGEHVHVLPHRRAELDTFLKSLAHAWKDGEVRPTHRKGPKPPRHWRTRKDPFEATWPRVVTWLESEPDRTAKELFARLRGECSDDLVVGQLRTLQRRVREWRRLAARRLVFAEPLADLRS